MGYFKIDIPEELHDKLRIQSVAEKRDMEEIVMTALLQYLKRHKEMREDAIKG